MLVIFSSVLISFVYSMQFDEDCDCGTTSMSTRIYGGNTTRVNQYPWMAHLRFFSVDRKRYSFCGGAVIDPEHIATAAHCIHDSKGNLRTLNSIEVYLGTNDLHKLPKPLNVSDLIYPINYDPKNPIEYDFALLRLSSKIKYMPSISPICLPAPLDKVPKRLIVAGWGYSTNQRNYLSNHLLHTTVDLIDNNRCESMRFEYINKLYPGKNLRLPPIHDNHICAMDLSSNQGDACQGDSGGPLMYYNPVNYKYYLIGVVSGGFAECGDPNTPTLYSLLQNFMYLIETSARQVKICD